MEVKYFLELFNKNIHMLFELTNKLFIIIKSPETISTLIGAFFGAISAYWLNTNSEKRKENLNNLENLNTTQVILIKELNNLLVFKQDLINPKVEEINKIFEQIKSNPNEVIEMHEVISTILSVLFYSSFETNNIKFISKNEPNHFLLLLQTQKTIKDLHNMIEEYNNYLQILCTEKLKDIGPSNYTYNELNRLKELVKCLIQLTNNAIYLSYKAIKENSVYLHNNFSRSIEFSVKDEYLYLLPTEQESPKGWTYTIKKNFKIKSYITNLIKKLFNRKTKLTTGVTRSQSAS